LTKSLWTYMLIVLRSKRGIRKVRVCLLLFSASLALVTVGADAPNDSLGVMEDYAGVVRLTPPGEEEFAVDESCKGKGIGAGTKIVTGKTSELRIRMQDGTGLRIKESSRAQLFKDEEKKVFGLFLAVGWIRAKIASDGFLIRTPAHSIGGAGLDVEVRVEKDGKLSLFCVEGKGFVEDKFGGVLSVSEGQKFDFWFDEERGAYCVRADEHNETDAEFVFEKERRKIEPGGGIALSKDGKLLPLVPPPPPRRDLEINVPEKAEEPKDEPYEDSGELQEAPYVSPKKPQK